MWQLWENFQKEINLQTRVSKPNRPNRLTECLNRFDRNRKPQKVTWTEPIKILLVFCIILTNFHILLSKKAFWANIGQNDQYPTLIKLGKFLFNHFQIPMCQLGMSFYIPKIRRNYSLHRITLGFSCQKC